MSSTSPTGDISGPVKWICAMTLGGVGVLGVGKGWLSEPPPTPVETPKLESYIVPEGGLVARIESNRSQLSSNPDAKVEQPVASIQKIININSASAAELELLPRIGPVMAQRIIDDRTANGPFENDRDLTRVRGIGPKTILKLSPLITFD